MCRPAKASAAVGDTGTLLSDAAVAVSYSLPTTSPSFCPEDSAIEMWPFGPTDDEERTSSSPPSPLRLSCCCKPWLCSLFAALAGQLVFLTLRATAASTSVVSPLPETPPIIAPAPNSGFALIVHKSKSTGLPARVCSIIGRIVVISQQAAKGPTPPRTKPGPKPRLRDKSLPVPIGITEM